MRKPYQVWDEIYVIGGPDISGPDDCSVYLIGGSQPVMIDTGAGNRFNRLVANIKSIGVDPGDIASIIITHAHIDHIGAISKFQGEFSIKLFAHALDCDAIETGKGTGAEFYGVPYHTCKVDVKLSKPEDHMLFSGRELHVVHIPGHTPGSIAVYVDVAGKRVLFGQDIHGPYLPEWGADRTQARASLKTLLELKADILCEGHFGIYEPSAAVRDYIQGYLHALNS